MRTLCLLSLLTAAVYGQDKKPDPKKPERIAINDPAKLKDDVDFQWSGEYLQSPDRPESSLNRLGTQIIARGNGKFEFVTFEGGLPGLDANIKRGDPIVSLLSEGALKVSDQPGFYKLHNGELVYNWMDKIATSKRQERKSPTLGAEPPKGAIVLFGKPEDVSKWEKMSTVKLSDGEYLSVGGRTKQKFQSFALHLEFRLPWMPNSTGQQRGNSGVYIQDRYEVQVLDSFGLKGEDNECGGIYKESKPKVNMCFPPMVWQTYDIDFTAATFENGKKVKPAVITVKHNGVVIHDKLELKSNTPGGGITKETPEPGAIYLQNHGDPVVFRNIWIVEK